MKKLLLALALFLLPSLACAQCNGVFPNNTVCGNVTGASNTPRAINPSAFLGAAGGTSGQIQYNNAGALGGFTQSGDCTTNTATGVTTCFASSPLSTARGGTGASNSTNATGDILASNSTNGTFVHTALNTLCSLIPTVCTNMLGYVNVTWYGAACDSTTNDLTAIQTAWTAAAAANVDVWLVGKAGTSSVSCFIGTGTLTMPTPTNQGGGSGFSKASMLRGTGAGLVRLLSTVSGTNCAVSISVTYGSNSSLGGILSGFTLFQSNTNQTGYGLCLTNVTSINLDDIAIQYFSRGVNAIDSISVNMTRMWIELNGTGIQSAYITNSPANAWNITQSNFDGQTSYAIAIAGISGAAGAKVFNIDHNTFQTNGTAGGAGSIYNVFDCSTQGGVGLNIIDNYFEGNSGVEVEFDAGTAANMQCVHNFKNNYVVRSLSSLTQGILIANSGTGTYQVTVNVEGNYFSDVLLTGSSYQWLAFSSSGATNSTFICDGNRVNVPAEINSRCGNVAASKTKSSDANAQWVGYN